MKTLFILRHAKSSRDDAGLADFDRPLNAKGLNQVNLVGSAIDENRIQPDLILSSPAKRAEQTAILVAEAARLENEIEYDERIYEASPHTLAQILSTLENKIEIVMLVGHNPGLEGLIKLLTGETRAMPTASLAKLNLNIAGWNEISADCASLESLETVKSKNE